MNDFFCKARVNECEWSIFFCVLQKLCAKANVISGCTSWLFGDRVLSTMEKCTWLVPEPFLWLLWKKEKKVCIRVMNHSGNGTIFQCIHHIVIEWFLEWWITLRIVIVALCVCIPLVVRFRLHSCSVAQFARFHGFTSISRCHVGFSVSFEQSERSNAKIIRDWNSTESPIFHLERTGIRTGRSLELLEKKRRNFNNNQNNFCNGWRKNGYKALGMH